MNSQYDGGNDSAVGIGGGGDDDECDQTEFFNTWQICEDSSVMFLTSLSVPAVHIFLQHFVQEIYGCMKVSCIVRRGNIYNCFICFCCY